MDIYALAEIAEAAQVEIQASCPLTDPVIGVSRNLRDAGFAVDVMTIDCFKSGKLDFTASYLMQSSCALIDPVVEQAIRVAKEYSSV
mgnify:CR=1 FL=1|tara:strand:- start:229 stop:489 length:261 start_codon:yes stop_codon:yes gene_type:complete